MLAQSACADSAATHKIRDHAMLTTSGNWLGHNANRQTFHIHKLIVKEQKIFLELVVAGMDPCVPESGSRGPKKRDGLINAVLVAHTFVITCDHTVVNVNVHDRSQNLSLQLSCQRRRAGSDGLARFVLEGGLARFVLEGRLRSDVDVDVDRIVIAC